jgi:hypothetical protein
MLLSQALARPRSWRLRAPASGCRAFRFFPSPEPRQVRLCETVGHSRQHMYQVAADVARYADFLPYCNQSSIIAQHSDTAFDAQLSLGFMAFTEDYVSRVQVRASASPEACRTG